MITKISKEQRKKKQSTRLTHVFKGKKMKRFFALFLLVFLSANLSAEGDKEDWLSDGGEEIIVKFESEPSGATVIVDGKVICQNTPCSQTITVGEHEIAMKKEDYMSKVKKGKITESKTIKYKLEPDGAYLTITGNEVEVSLDGENIGLIPIKNKIIPAGEHRIEHSNPCYSEQVEIFTVTNGEKKKIDFKLKPRESAIKVYAKDGRGNAVEADVYVDGKKLGKAPGTFKVPLCSQKVVVTKKDFDLEAAIKERNAYSRDKRIIEIEYSEILSLEEKQVKTIQASLLQWFEEGTLAGFESAQNYCKNLNAGGFNDWRLPNIEELRTLIKNSPETEIGGECKASDQNGEFRECDCKGVYTGVSFLDRMNDRQHEPNYYSKLRLGENDIIKVLSYSSSVIVHDSWTDYAKCGITFGDYEYGVRIDSHPKSKTKAFCVR